MVSQPLKEKLELLWITNKDTDLYNKQLKLRELIHFTSLGLKLEDEPFDEDHCT